MLPTGRQAIPDSIPPGRRVGDPPPLPQKHTPGALRPRGSDHVLSDQFDGAASVAPSAGAASVAAASAAGAGESEAMNAQTFAASSGLRSL